MWDFLIRVTLFVIPAYFANMTPTIFPGKTPLDFNKKFSDGRAIFGKGKTFEGSIVGVMAGVLISVFVFYLAPEATASLTSNYILLGIFIAIGAITGDIVASFFKRRLGKERGVHFFPLDQLDFILGAMLFGSVLYVPTIWEIIFMLIVTIILHRVTNFIAYATKIKKVPW